MKDSPSPTPADQPTLRDAMDAYRVAAMALADLHAKSAPAPVTDEARADLADASRALEAAAGLPVIAGLQASLNEMHIRAVDAESGFPCLAERDAIIANLRRALDAANARVASIVAFHGAEAVKFDAAAEHFEEVMRNADAADRCLLRAGLCRTLAAQIARGEDLRGGK